MRTTASLAAFVTLMAVANSNAAPIGTPNGSSARSVSRARGLRSRDVPPMPNFRQDMSFTVGVPDPKCGDCREGEAKKVSMDMTGPVADMEGGVKDMKNKVSSADVQVPGVPSGSGSIDIDVDVNDDGPDNNASTRPQKHANDSPEANSDANNDANNAHANDGANDDGKPDDGRTDDGKTDGGQPQDGGKADPPAEQSPSGAAENEVKDMRDEVKDQSKNVEDMARETMAKAEGKSDQVGDDAKAASSSMNQGAHEFADEMKNKVADVGSMSGPDMGIHAEVKMDAENRQDSAGKSFKMPEGNGIMPRILTVSQDSSSENTDGKECEDKTTVEMQQGDPSVSTSVLRR